MVQKLLLIILLAYPHVAFGSLIAKIINDFPVCKNILCFERDLGYSSLQKIQIDKEISSLISAIPLLKYYSEALNQQGIPGYYAFIPLIESSNLPTAVSSAGASGVWQLMPSTAFDGGIFYHNSYDYRHDLYLSTMVAVRHIKILDEKYFGNLAIVLAAYNWGGANVDRLLKKFNNTDDFFLNLPEETKSYIRKFYRINNNLQTINFSHPIWSYPDVHYLMTVTKKDNLNDILYNNNKISSFLNPIGFHRNFYVVPTENFNKYYQHNVSVKSNSKTVVKSKQNKCFFDDLYQTSYIIKSTDTVISLSKLLGKDELLIIKNYVHDGKLKVGMVIRMSSKKLDSSCF
jgi:hypothetical protein